MILYHGTTAHRARQIRKQGFKDMKIGNWPVKGKRGFAYFSLAYAPFYAMSACKKTAAAALIKVEIDEPSLFPEDDFIMLMLKTPKYNQRQIDALELESFKYLYEKSLLYMGNAAAQLKDVNIVGVREFDCGDLLWVCDPVISPTNYLYMGDYYRKLTERIFETGNFKDYSFQQHCGIGTKVEVSV